MILAMFAPVEQEKLGNYRPDFLAPVIKKGELLDKNVGESTF